jgi:mono/diheme cytochrome c family protein
MQMTHFVFWYMLLILQAPQFQTQESAPQVTRTDYDLREAVKPASLSESEIEGRRLWVQRCALCHDPLGQPTYPRSLGPWVDRETIKARGEDRIRQQINVGSRRMPGWRYTLEPAQVDQLMAYLKVVTPDQKPKPTGSGTQLSTGDDR